MNKVKEIIYGNTKCYLINNKIMIDIDCAGTLQNFFRCIKKEGLEIKNIEHLIITHFHPEHMGIAQDIDELGIIFIGLIRYLSKIKRWSLKVLTKIKCIYKRMVGKSAKGNHFPEKI